MRAFADEMLHRQRKRNSSCRKPGRTRRSRRERHASGPRNAGGDGDFVGSPARSRRVLKPPTVHSKRGAVGPAAHRSSLSSAWLSGPRGSRKSHEFQKFGAVTASACDACARAITSPRVIPFTSEALVTGLPNANAAEARKKPTLIETSFNQVRRCVPNRLEDESRDACLSWQADIKEGRASP